MNNNQQKDSFLSQCWINSAGFLDICGYTIKKDKKLFFVIVLNYQTLKFMS